MRPSRSWGFGSRVADSRRGGRPALFLPE